jgi:hypothetical protein
MYLFNLDDFKCDQLPTDWEDYQSSIRYLFNENLKCLGKLIESKQGEYTTEFYNKVWALFLEYKDAVDECQAVLYILIQELYANPSGSNCFDKTLYTNYLASYAIVQNLLQELNLLITTGGDFIGYDLNVGSDTTVIYPVSGSSSTKVSTCTGVYMKQMDFGSEFIGTVTVMGGVEEPYVGEWDGLARPYDGEWIVRYY